MVAQEIQQAEETILLSLGVSRELLSGITNWTSSSVGLRMMENLLTSYISRIQDMLDWIFDRVTGYLGMERVGVSLIPFKLLDDDNFKNLLIQLASTQDISKTTLFEELGLDYHDERKRVKHEAADKAAFDVEVQKEVDIAHFVAAKGAGEDMEENEEYKTILREASGIAAQLTGQDPATVQNLLAELRIENYTMYVMVNKLLAEQVPEEPLDPSQDPNAQGGQGKKEDSGKPAKKDAGPAKANAKMNDFAPPKDN
jgi:hypothetical protein